MVPMNAFGREPEELVVSQCSAMQRVLRSGWWILGAEVEAFETEWSTYCGCARAVGVGNGMDALEIGLRVLGIGPGDEVITTPMTAFATVLAILRGGATPVLADIDPATAILDLASVSRCVTPRTRAVLVVHLYGQAAPLETLADFCTERGLELIEDCAQAHGAKWNGRPVGGYGRVAGWSFYPTKNLGTMGDGGALTTNSVDLAEAAAKLRNYGQSVRYEHPVIGMNSRLDEVHAAILRERLIHLPAWTERRRIIARRYEAGISNPLVEVLPLPAEPERHVHHLCVVTSPHRAELSATLSESGIESLIHYPIPIHRQASCRGMRTDPNGLPQAEAHAATCLSIPCNPFLSEDEVTRVIAALNNFTA
jgi:dTDP-4-amino-4,6-dideoxygalactose transaminase